MIPNTNPETGIAYGVIALAHLNSDYIDPLTDGIDMSWAEFERKYRAEMTDLLSGVDDPQGDIPDLIDEMFEEEAHDYYCDEPVYESKPDAPIKWRMSWLGGAAILFVFDSPHTVMCHPCSPCVPNAGDLDSKGGNTLTYDVPPDWYLSKNPD